MSGKFIVIEGLDGSGKTTQLRLLAEYLRGRGRRVFLTREPTESVSGGLLRDALSGETRRTPAEMAALFVLDRIHHNQSPVSGIEKMLADGYDVLCDRYYYSSLAYQGTLTDFEWVRRMNVDCPEIRHPDLCVFLDTDVDVCLGRIGANRATTEIYERRDTLAAVRKNYFHVLNSLDDNVAVIVDNGGDIECVATAIRGVIDPVFGF